MQPDRNVLFGAIATQSGLLTADRLAEACALSGVSKATSLPQICRDQGWLSFDDVTHVDYLVDRRLNRCGGDIRAALAICPNEILTLLADAGSKTGTSGPIETVDLGSERDGELGLAQAGRRYSLRKLHAAGGIGEIWKARDADLGREVAIKRLQRQVSGSSVHKSRFLREARITGQLDHPGVVPIYELCLDEESGQHYYSMRFLNGRTMTDAVAKYQAQRKALGSDPQSLFELLNAFCIVCSTVAYAHSKGIVHRDLKCENVILGDYGEVVVIDWGLAKEFGSADNILSEADSVEPTANPVATLAGHILGTPAYMAPEQASGQLDLIGPATDIYGLCAILYEILTGQPPFLGATASEVLQYVQRDEPVAPSDLAPGVPESLERICLKGLAKSPNERHASAEQLAKAVQAWVSDLAERRQSEDERERFFALSLDFLAIIDAKGSLRQISPAWQNRLGHEVKELVGQPFTDCLHVDDRTAAQNWIKGAGGVLGDFEARVLQRDGNHRWVSWNKTVIAKEKCIYIVGRDITDLKKSQQLFEGILRSAPDAMVIIDRDRNIIITNLQTERLFGYTQAEMIGQPVEMLVPERFRDHHPAHVEDFFAKSSVRPMGAGLQLWGRRKDGREFSVDISISPIIIESGMLVAASIREQTALASGGKRKK